MFSAKGLVLDSRVENVSLAKSLILQQSAYVHRALVPNASDPPHDLR